MAIRSDESFSAITDLLDARMADLIVDWQIKFGELNVTAKPDKIVQLLRSLREGSGSRFDVLIGEGTWSPANAPLQMRSGGQP